MLLTTRKRMCPMSFKVEFEFNTLTELQDFINSKDAVEIKSSKTPKVARGPKPEILLPEEKSDLVEVSEPVVEKKKDILIYDYVAKATTETVAALGREPVLALLKELGFSTAKELPEDLWPTYLKRCGDLLKNAKEAELA